MLAALRGGSRVVGVNQLKRAVEADRIDTVFVADDAERKVLLPLLEMCAVRGIEPQHVPTMKALGEACGIQVGASAAGLLKCLADSDG